MPNTPRPSVIIRKHENRRLFKFLAFLGVALVLVELGLSYRTGQKMNGMRLLVGSIIGFVGFYGLDPKELREAGTLVYTWASGILLIVRAGKRTTDTSETKVVTTVDLSHEPPTVETHAERSLDEVKVPHSKDEDLSHD